MDQHIQICSNRSSSLVSLPQRLAEIDLQITKLEAQCARLLEEIASYQEHLKELKAVVVIVAAFVDAGELQVVNRSLY